jgi:signal transduction histidine kinase
VKITRKIALLIAVPLVAVLVFAALAVAATTGQARAAQRLRSLVQVSAAQAGLAQRLQAERALAVARLTGVPGVADDFDQAVADTDAAVGAYRAARAALGSPPAGAAALLAQVDTQLGLLGGLREQVRSDRGVASGAAFGYRIVIASTIAFRQAAAQAGGASAVVADRMRAAVELSQAAEALGQQQVTVLQAAAFGVLTPVAARDVASARSAYTDAVDSFLALAPPPWQGWWQASLVGDQVAQAQMLQDAVGRAAAVAVLRVDTGAWIQLVTGRVDAVHQVEAHADAQVLDQVGALRAGAWRSAGAQTGAVLLTVVLAVLVGFGLGRPILRGLHRLREGAQLVAFTRLPQAVAALESAELVAAAPSRLVAQVEPIGVGGRDEIAEVATALDAVHREAVRIAAEQALSRLGVQVMFVTLARRLQARVGQLTTLLDTAERDEQDPAVLDRLFGIDHGVSLMRRTTDSLLVLGGQGQARVRPEDVELAKVLQAAAGHVQDYRRVEYRHVDDGVRISAALVDDVVLLLAELVDNATTYSQGPVMVDARLLGDRVVVQVVDHGVGIEQARRAELNRRLAHPPRVDVDAVRAMGLSVVGLLAARHDLAVELRPGVGGGTIAELTLRAGLWSLAPARPAHTRPELPAPPTPPAVVPRQRGGQVPTPACADTVELPIYQAVTRTQDQPPAAAPNLVDQRQPVPDGEGLRTAHGLPRRRPRTPGHDAGDARAVVPPSQPPRDPLLVAAALAAWGRGVAGGRMPHLQPLPVGDSTGAIDA